MSKPRILIVDDEASVLLTYSTILQQQGYEVEGALSSSEARAFLEARNFDMILCDLSLERNHSGFEVIDFARKRDPRICPVLLTGYAGDDITQQAQSRGVIVLFKPVQIEELLATVADLVRKEKAG